MGQIMKSTRRRRRPAPRLINPAFTSLAILLSLTAVHVVFSLRYDDGEREVFSPRTITLLESAWFAAVILTELSLVVVLLRYVRSGSTNEKPIPDKALSDKQISSNTGEQPRSEEYLRSLLDNSAMFIIRTDMEGKYTYANRSFLEVFVSKEKMAHIVGEFSMTYIVPEDHVIAIQAVERCLAHPSRCVLVTLRKPSIMNGAILTTDWEFTAIRNMEGVVSEIQCTGIDVTKQNNIAKELRNAEEHFRSAVNALGEGIVLQGPDGTIAFCNARAEEILGLTANQMSGRTSLDPLWRTIHEDGSPFPGNTHPAMETLRTGQALHNIVMGVHKPNGDLTWILINTQPIHYASTVDISGVVASFTDISVQKAQEKELRANEERYRFITENSLDLIALHTPEGIYTYLSPSVESLLGFIAHELLGQNPYDYFHPDDSERIRQESHAQALRGESNITVTYRIRHKNGTYLWFETKTKALLHAETNDVVALQTFSRDVTERMRMQKDLLHAKQLLDETGKVARTGGWELLVSSGELSWTKETYDIHELPNDTALSVAIAVQFYHPDDQTIIRHAIENLIAHAEQYDLELRLITAKNKELWVRSIGKCEMDTNNTVHRLFGTLQDITQEVEARNHLQKREQFIKTVTDSLPSMVGYWTADLQCSFANTAYQEWFGKKPTEILGMHIRELLGEKLFEKNEPYIRKALAGKSQQFERTLVKPSGEVGYTLSQYIPDIADGRVRGFIVLVTDITDIKKTQENLNTAQRLAHIGSWEWDIVANTIHWSDEQYRLFGEDMQSFQATYEGYLSHLSPDERERTNTLVSMALEGRENYALEHEIKRPDGSTLFVFEQGAVVVDVNNTPIRMVGTTQDITVRKKAEEAIRQSEANLKAIFDASVQIHYLVDRHFRILAYNKIAGERVRQSLDREILLGDDMRNYIMPADKASFEERFALALRGISSRIEKPLDLPNLGTLWFEFQYVPVRDIEGTIIGVSFSALDITDRKYADEKLATSEHRYRSFVELQSTYFIRTDLEGKYTYASPSILNDFSPDKVSVIGKSGLDHIIPDDHGVAHDAVARCLQNPGTPIPVVLRKPHVSGQTWTTEWEFISIPNSNGSISEIQCVGHDITARVDAQALLKTSEEKYRSMVHNIADIITLLDSNGIIVYESSSIQQILGYDEYELVGKHIFELLHPDDKAFIGAAFQQAAQQKGNGPIVEFRYLHKQGYYVTLEARSNNQLHNPAINAVIVNSRDISERKEMLLRMAEYSQELQSIIDSMMDGLVLLDEEQRIVLVNPALREMFGYTEEDLLGASISMLLPERLRSLHSAHVEQFRSIKAERRKTQLPIGLRSDGNEFPIDASIANFSVNGKVMLLAIIRDITEPIRIQEELLNLNKTLEDRVEDRTRRLVLVNQEKDEFMGIAAHDLKNPLAGILSSAEILQRYYADDETAKRFIAMIMSASDQMLDIIKNLLDVNRIESGLLRVTMNPLSLAIVQPIVQNYQSRAANKGIILHTQTLKKESIPTILADEQAFLQVMDNLISNAVKYSPHWKNVWVTITSRTNENGTIVGRIEVKDEGPGLSEDDQKKLFGKFARLTPQPTSGENSTGLGLSIVKKLVELQDGKVWCESSLGKGATFFLEFPTAAE